MVDGGSTLGSSRRPDLLLSSFWETFWVRKDIKFPHNQQQRIEKLITPRDEIPVFYRFAGEVPREYPLKPEQKLPGRP